MRAITHVHAAESCYNSFVYSTYETIGHFSAASSIKKIYYIVGDTGLSRRNLSVTYKLVIKENAILIEIYILSLSP